MNRLFRNILLALSLLATSVAVAGPTTIKATLDSVYIVMGQVTPLHVSIVQDAGAQINPLQIPDMIMPGVEKHSQTVPDTTDLGNNRLEIKQDIVLQSFDSGVYMLPPLQLVQGGETIKSNQVVLKVVPVDVDTMKTVHDYAGVADVERNWLDYLPDWLLDYGIFIIIGLALIALAIFLYLRYFKGDRRAKAKKKAEPPYDVAMRELHRLDSEKLPERGEEKEFYTRLTEILRVYLSKRFGINAMEMTSSQILDAISKNEETRPSEQLIQQILEIADFVKFAKMRPLPTDNVASFTSALNFVENTKPVPKPEAEGEGEDPSKTKLNVKS